MGLMPLQKAEEAQTFLWAVSGYCKLLAVHRLGSGFSPEPTHTGTMISGVLPPESGEIHVCCSSHPVDSGLL